MTALSASLTQQYSALNTLLSSLQTHLLVPDAGLRQPAAGAGHAERLSRGSSSSPSSGRYLGLSGIDGVVLVSPYSPQSKTRRLPQRQRAWRRGRRRSARPGPHAARCRARAHVGGSSLHRTGETRRKAGLLHSAVILVAELRGSLNLQDGGPLAQNLNDLYDYMTPPADPRQSEQRRRGGHGSARPARRDPQRLGGDRPAGEAAAARPTCVGGLIPAPSPRRPRDWAQSRNATYFAARRGLFLPRWRP